MSINTIRVQDFQSIKNAEVELGSFTVFTGPSSSGKSAFMRAAHGIARNSFTPTQVRNGGKECIVTLTTGEDTIQSIRGKSKSTYKLNEEIFTKSGRDVPPPVQEALSLPLISEVDATFASQFDKPFLLAEPGATAARVLGSLTNVSVLHNSLRETNRRALEAKGIIKTRRGDIDQAAQLLETFSGLEERRAAVDAACEVFDAVESKWTDAGVFEDFLADLEKTAEALQDVRFAQVDLSSVEVALEEVSAKVEEYASLSNLQSRINEIQANMPEVDYSSLKNASIPEVDTYVDLERFLSTLASKVKELKTATDNKTSLDAKLQDLQTEYDTMIDELGGVCPLCGNELEGEHL